MNAPSRTRGSAGPAHRLLGDSRGRSAPTVKHWSKKPRTATSSRGATCAGYTARQLGGEEVAAIVRAAADGDEQAWETLVQRFTGLIRATARAHRLSDADAVDVAQATWLRVIEHIDRLKDPGRLGGWIATTARRECLRVLRGAARQVPTEQAFFENQYDETSVEDDLLLKERDAALRQAVDRLPARDQDLLCLLMAEPSASYAQISVALEKPIGAIGPTRGRCLERLRREADSVGLGSPHVHEISA